MSKPVHGDPTIDKTILDLVEDAKKAYALNLEKLLHFSNTLFSKTNGKPGHENLSLENARKTRQVLTQIENDALQTLMIINSCKEVCTAAAERTIIQKLGGHIGATK